MGIKNAQLNNKSSPNNKTYKLPSKQKRHQKIANNIHIQIIDDSIPIQTLNKLETTQTQLPYSTKSCYQQKDLQNKLHQFERANGDSVRRFVRQRCVNDVVINDGRGNFANFFNLANMLYLQVSCELLVQAQNSTGFS
ncbi:Hypothetical_protein [Hexamita inflata]|uniref:Hypothetical_protein n=1 Tax=Hexamita inflata TaxID=28002 RepID=A0AA86UAJ9_9EUKA|nr:Hypothetical protein HINF_LOCUS31382 [Hexamita inflata]